MESWGCFPGFLSSEIPDTNQVDAGTFISISPKSHTERSLTLSGLHHTGPAAVSTVGHSILDIILVPLFSHWLLLPALLGHAPLNVQFPPAWSFAASLSLSLSFSPWVGSHLFQQL